ncbi:energy-coupling factor transporter transmembrane protein EcfT [Schaalia sp. Marseille-Q2122]|uniref:energy-coupling factor transporter transmembrane component T family protein n=1 Tax=Schaalia sp. Marseille-Q2122 TaxID=2736604 RepID=UPI00158EF408|nr:energy-coupling factor transporter transmembrane component T [Schaalia sp. Marseille-Q2122]
MPDLSHPRTWLHPLVTVCIPLPVLIIVLRTQSLSYILAIMICVLVYGFLLRWRWALKMTLSIAAIAAFLALSLSLWLPQQAAITLALRMIAMLITLAVPFTLADWRTIADSCVKYLRLPYQLVDVVSMGDRFFALMRRDLQEISTHMRVRARGSRLLYLRMLPAALMPVLVAAFRQADTTALALETRGFSRHPYRTTHSARPITVLDVLVLLAAWAVSIAGLWVMPVIAPAW